MDFLYILNTNANSAPLLSEFRSAQEANPYESEILMVSTDLGRG